MRRFSKHHFAGFVKRTRESRKLSIRQTAKKSGITLSRVFAIENGESRLSVPQLLSLADAFGFRSGAEFLGRYEKTLGALAPVKARRRKDAEALA